MSGSPGGQDPFYSSPTNDCAGIVIRTHLSSPNATVATGLNVGDTLNIGLGGSTGPLQVITLGGTVAGTIISREQAKLINCINDGFEYKAKVVSISGGNCELLITIA